MPIITIPPTPQPTSAIQQMQQKMKELQGTVVAPGAPPTLEKLEKQLEKAKEMSGGFEKAHKLEKIADGYEALGNTGKASSLHLKADLMEKKALTKYYDL